ncbi:MAG: glutathione S-transferase N-terminal domain-containing protein, partial [Gammaproteobacteria bacterium]|nr:glutathione S-transferase N-terminal domain-containing protein [Gammaproteobacteria bacterium]
MSGPILYSFRRCPYAMRARLALKAADVRLEIREVVLKDKPAEMLMVSPKATVPVLVFADGQVIDESLDIMHWALMQLDSGESFETDKAAAEPLLTVNDGKFKYHL